MSVGAKPKSRSAVDFDFDAQLDELWTAHESVMRMVWCFEQVLDTLQAARPEDVPRLADELTGVFGGYSAAYYEVDATEGFFTAGRNALFKFHAVAPPLPKFLDKTASSLHCAVTDGIGLYIRQSVNDLWQSPNEFVWNWDCYFSREKLEGLLTGRFQEWWELSADVDQRRDPHIRDHLNIEMIEAVRVFHEVPLLTSGPETDGEDGRPRYSTPRGKLTKAIIEKYQNGVGADDIADQLKCHLDTVKKTRDRYPELCVPTPRAKRRNNNGR